MKHIKQKKKFKKVDNLIENLKEKLQNKINIFKFLLFNILKNKYKIIKNINKILNFNKIWVFK